jgi:hypothetical protein
MYEELLDADSTDEAARIGRARARFWMGEGETALADLEGVESEEAEELRDAIGGAGFSYAEVGYSAYTDADDQELDTVHGGIGVAADAQSMLEGEVRRSVASEPGSEDVRLLRFSVGGSRQFNRGWAIHAYATLGRIAAEGDIPAGEGETVLEEDAERDLFLADTWITFTPWDWTRFDAGYARVPIETPKSLARGIVIDLYSLSAMRRLHDRVAVEGSGSFGDYSDDNSRVAGTGSIVFQPFLSFPLRFDAGASAFTFDQSVDHGYYNPETYDALFVGAAYAEDLWERLNVEVFGRLSSERENDEDRFGVGAGGIDAALRLRRSLVLAAFVRKTTSRFDTGAGYSREGWGVSLRWTP